MTAWAPSLGVEAGVGALAAVIVVLTDPAGEGVVTLVPDQLVVAFTPVDDEERLGHSSPVITLETYAHLWPGEDDAPGTSWMRL